MIQTVFHSVCETMLTTGRFFLTNCPIWPVTFGKILGICLRTDAWPSKRNKEYNLSYDVTSGSDIMACIKIDKQLVNYIIVFNYM